MPIYIYALICPETKELRYVGKAADVEFRVGRHVASCKAALRVHYPVNRWLSKLRDRGLRPEWIVLEQTTDDGWVEAEKRWIAYYRSQGTRLLNVTDGGEGASYKSTPERNRKIAEAQRGKVMTQEVREKIAASLSGRKLPPDPRRGERLKGNKLAAGRTLAPIHREQALAALRTPTAIQRRIAGLKLRAKTWIVTLPNGDEERIDNLVEFSIQRGLDAGCMNKIAHGRQGRKQHKGFSVRPA